MEFRKVLFGGYDKKEVQKALDMLKKEYEAKMESMKKEFDTKVESMNKEFMENGVPYDIKAIMRRTDSKNPSNTKTKDIISGNVRLDCEGRRCYIAGKEMGLTAKEFEVLELLMLNPDKVYSRDELLKLVWGEDYPGDVRTVDVHIRRLREKIEENPSEPKFVHTKWGVGYYFLNE